MEGVARGGEDSRRGGAVYQTVGGDTADGWRRGLLDTYGFGPKSLTPQEVEGQLTFDAIILPDVPKNTVATGKRSGRGEEGGGVYEAEMPPE